MAVIWRWPLFRGLAKKINQNIHFIGFFVVLMALMRQYPRELGKNNQVDRKMAKLRENKSYHQKNFRYEIGKD